MCIRDRALKAAGQELDQLLAQFDAGRAIREGVQTVIAGRPNAGKSTLMKILSGAYSKDTGKILIDGREVNIRHTKDSEKLGISIIYQELNLIPEMSVAEKMCIRDRVKRNH